MATKKEPTPTARGAPPVDPTPSATATNRVIAAVVSDGQVDAAELALSIFDNANGTAFSGAFVMWNPTWDGFEEPMPTPMCWFQFYNLSDLTLAAKFEQAMTSLSSIGVRWYEAIVPPDELGNPSNTVNSIYGVGYDPELPVEDPFAAAAAWRLDVVGSLPPRAQFP